MYIEIDINLCRICAFAIIFCPTRHFMRMDLSGTPSPKRAFYVCFFEWKEDKPR